MTPERHEYLKDLETKLMAANLKGIYCKAINNDETSIPTLLVMTLPESVATIIEVYASISAKHIASWIEFFFVRGIDAVCQEYNLNDAQTRELLYKDAKQVAETLTGIVH